jgi:hypothetical protein
MSTADHGALHICKGPGAVANGMTGIQNAVVKCPFMLNWECKHSMLTLKSSSSNYVGLSLSGCEGQATGPVLPTPLS